MRRKVDLWFLWKNMKNKLFKSKSCTSTNFVNEYKLFLLLSCKKFQPVWKSRMILTLVPLQKWFQNNIHETTYLPRRRLKSVIFSIYLLIRGIHLTTYTKLCISIPHITLYRNKKFMLDKMFQIKRFKIRHNFGIWNFFSPN